MRGRAEREARARSPQDLKCGASDLPLLSAVMRFATLANLVGLPAVSLPVGQDAAGARCARSGRRARTLCSSAWLS